MIINHNIAALNTYRQLSANNTGTQKALEKLSSGLRINRAGDDAAGLAISEKMRGQIRGLEMASKNAQDGISLIQTAEGALNETHSILQRMRELAVQAASDTNTDDDRAELQKEMDQLREEINRIADTTEFNTKKLLNGDLQGVSKVDDYAAYDEDNSVAFSSVSIVTSASLTDNTYNVRITGASTGAGTFTIQWTDAFGGTGSTTIAKDAANITIKGVQLKLSGSLTEDDIGEEVTFTTRKADTSYDDNSLTFQIGANSSQMMRVDIGDVSAQALHLETAAGTGIDITTAQAAEAAISAVDKAIQDVSAERSKLGAFQNRLEHTINNLGTSAENLTAAESRIRDVDMAEEMMEFTKLNILSQAAQAMLAQANQLPQGVLQLLR